MGSSVRYLFSILVIAVALLAAAMPAYAQLSIEGVRFGMHQDKTRLVIDLNSESPFKAFVLSSPYRVVVDLPQAQWQASGPYSDERNLFTATRYGNVRDGVSRVVFEASAPVVIERAFRLPAQAGRPHRLVLDVRTAPRGVATASLSQVFGNLDTSPMQKTHPEPAVPEPAVQEPAVKVTPAVLAAPAQPTGRTPLVVPHHEPHAAPRITQAALSGPVPPAPGKKPDINSVLKNAALDAPAGELLKGIPAPDMVVPKKRPARKLILLDPGHGGKDPGAIGANGVYEKHITLKMAHELKDILEASGRYRVALTRDRDTFIDLYDRRDLAHAVKADMFISLHADSVERGNARGASIYTLSDTASDKESARLAASENRSGALVGLDLSNEGADVANILIDLAMNENMNQSRLLANKMVDAFRGNGVRTLSTAHRNAGFAVLKTADTPSVLIELGFLSSPQEVRALSSAAHRYKLGRSILRGIDAYFARVDQLHRS